MKEKDEGNDMLRFTFLYSKGTSHDGGGTAGGHGDWEQHWDGAKQSRKGSDTSVDQLFSLTNARMNSISYR